MIDTPEDRETVKRIRRHLREKESDATDDDRDESELEECKAEEVRFPAR